VRTDLERVRDRVREGVVEGPAASAVQPPSPLRPVGSDDLPPPRIHMVLNWFDELRARVPVD
jgi:hypothetical protein